MSGNYLLTRENFKSSIFKRDGGICVVCGLPAEDAHHLIERRLWSDGGYYESNGVALCAEHHIMAEQTILSVEKLRDLAGITDIIVPEHFVKTDVIDKWGNPILDNGNRMCGELFWDSGVQSILRSAGMLGLFNMRMKYPRTYHLPWSLGLSKDDKRIDDMSGFVGKRVIVTVKMDGENTTIYPDGFVHARSIDSKRHESRSWVKNFAATIAPDIPSGWRVCGENLFAKHTIAYNDLPSYFLGFSIWNDKNVALSWDDTEEWFSLIGISPVEKIYDGTYDQELIRSLSDQINHNSSEGYVLRIADKIPYGQFRKFVAKYVRANHVNKTVHHWFSQEIVPNKLNSAEE